MGINAKPIGMLKNAFKKIDNENEREKKALKNLIQDYTRQKQINEEHQNINGELRERIKELDTKNDELLNDLYNANCIIADLTDSIPKQVVIDKIKEYDKKMEEDAGHPNWVVTDRIVMNVLQELLETK